jgi:hypothetical protein
MEATLQRAVIIHHAAGHKLRPTVQSAIYILEPGYLTGFDHTDTTKKNLNPDD